MQTSHLYITVLFQVSFVSSFVEKIALKCSVLLKASVQTTLHQLIISVINLYQFIFKS